MKKRANVLKKAAALLAIMVGGVVFCCSRRTETATDDLVLIRDVSLDADLSREVPESRVSEEESAVLPETQTDTDIETESESGIWVYVCGAVQCPGVYYLPSDARVFEAVDLAGGFLPDACADAVNLAGTMSDGEQIFVPDVSEASAESGTAAGQAGVSQSPGKVNINRAEVSELMTLPGIGESKAQAIVSYRQEHPFQSIEEIMNVSGIKEGSFEKIRDLITT